MVFLFYYYALRLALLALPLYQFAMAHKGLTW